MIPDIDLLTRYNVAVPRYTSYPTVPYWSEQVGAGDWEASFRRAFDVRNAAEGIALYIHLPFCEKLCTYCGCNKKITTNHSVEADYITAIHNEWAIYSSWMQEPPVLRELHLGGGTPTFFSPSNLERLLAPILEACVLHPQYEFSFEGHPNNTTREHLEALYRLGFRRVSYGVQDNDAHVQYLIGRVQPFDNVKRVTEEARAVGYQSVNFDLIYGLPGQTTESIVRTIEEVISLRPDRVAFYSYAHVPWTSRGQRLFDENDLPSASEKLMLYVTGKTLFLENGYADIGMDHFALPQDDLYKAAQDGRLNRNFMGYTTSQAEILLGLGVSGISNTADAYMQNDKTIHDYYSAVNSGQLAIRKGCLLTAQDRRFGRYIRDISCNGTARFAAADLGTIAARCLPALERMADDGLLCIGKENIVLTPLGRNFTRNICSALDLHLHETRAASNVNPVFSKAI